MQKQVDDSFKNRVKQYKAYATEGLILAQDKRWRRASYMQVEREPLDSSEGESGERVSNT